MLTFPIGNEQAQRPAAAREPFQLHTPPSTQPLVLHVTPQLDEETPLSRRAKDRFRRPHANADSFPDPEHLPSTSASLFSETRHTAPRFAAGSHASGALSLIRCSRTDKLGATQSRGLFTARARGVTRRLSTSAVQSIASTTTGVRTPPTKPSVARRVSSAPRRVGRARAGGVASHEASPTEESRARGL
jgi:hypothetical protein